MTHYSVQPRNQIFVKGYEFLSFAKNIGKNVGKNTRKNFGSKCSPKRPDHAKQSAVDALKTTSKKVQFKKRAEATGDLIGNKIDDKIIRVSKTTLKNNAETNEKRNT